MSDSIDTDKEGNSLSLMDVVSVEDDILEELSLKETNIHLRKYIESSLNEREREIVTMRYGIKGEKPKTQREVAKICGISRSYVSRIEKKAIEKLRKCFENEE